MSLFNLATCHGTSHLVTFFGQGMVGELRNAVLFKMRGRGLFFFFFPSFLLSLLPLCSSVLPSFQCSLLSSLLLPMCCCPPSYRAVLTRASLTCPLTLTGPPLILGLALSVSFPPVFFLLSASRAPSSFLCSGWKLPGGTLSGGVPGAPFWGLIFHKCLFRALRPPLLSRVFSCVVFHTPS